MTMLFTYGTLMFDEVWNKLVSQYYVSNTIELTGFERRALQNANYPAAIPNPSASIKGRLYYDVSNEDMDRLHEFEGELYEFHKATINEGDVGIYLIKPDYYHLLMEHDWNEGSFKQQHLTTFLATYQNHSF